MNQLLARVVNEEPDMVVKETCTDGVALLRVLQSQKHHVAVIDPNGMRPTGPGILSDIRATDPDVKIVIVTGSQQESDLHVAIRAGARGYISKSSGVSEVLSAIRAAYRGGAKLSHDRTAQLMDAFARQTMDETGLSPRQRDILKGLVQGKTNREIAYDLSLSEKTIKNYMRSLFSALGCRDRTEAAIVGIRRGIVSVGDNSISNDICVQWPALSSVS